MAIEHTYRNNGNGDVETCDLTPILAIRKFCIECMGFKVRDVKKCTDTLCKLFPFRMGRAHTPGRARKNTPKKAAPGAISSPGMDDRLGVNNSHAQISENHTSLIERAHTAYDADCLF